MFNSDNLNVALKINNIINTKGSGLSKVVTNKRSKIGLPKQSKPQIGLLRQRSYSLRIALEAKSWQ